jgi:hypothetical protein
MYQETTTVEPIRLDDVFAQAVLDEHIAVVKASQAGKPIKTGNATYAVTRPASIPAWADKPE